MKTQIKRTAILATAISLILASGFAMAAGNAITFEGDTNNGTGNYGNVTATGTGTNVVSIYQVGTGDGTDATKQNQVGTAANSLILNGSTTATAHIGQGAYYDGTSWAKTKGVQNNIVKGTITSGIVEVSQNSGDATHANSVTLDVNGSGKVIVNQGNTGATVGGGGSGMTATVTQTSTGAVTINQGNHADSTASGLTATVTQNGGGSVTVSQGSSANSAGTSGSVTVVHEGTHTVDIIQDRATAGSNGVVKTNTTGNGVAALVITHSNSGKTFVDVTGDGTGTAATITANATLTNSGTGDLGLKQATGVVTAVYSGSNKLTIDNGGTSNEVLAYVAGAGDTKINVVGTSNGVYVNTAGTKIGTTASTIGGTLTLNSDGTSNNMYVKDFAGGTMTVNQGSAMQNSNLTLNGTSLAGNTIVNQSGSYQNATVHSVNGSTGTFDLKEVGLSGTPTTIDLTL